MALCEFLTVQGGVVAISTHYVIAVEQAPNLPKAGRKQSEPVACATIFCAGNRTYTVIGSQKSVAAKISKGE